VYLVSIKYDVFFSFSSHLITSKWKKLSHKIYYLYGLPLHQCCIHNVCPTGEYWLGLETLHLLTTSPSTLWVHIESFGDVTPPTLDAHYDVFSVGDASTNYRLTVSGFTGNCNDSLAYHNGQMFTTIDRDNDGSSNNCAMNHKGGFWYTSCVKANPTGLYFPRADTFSSQGLLWTTCYGVRYSARVYILKFKRNM